jgi:hypothetical protein
LEEREAAVWDHYISPAGLLDLIWSTAPYLKRQLPAPDSKAEPIALARGPHGFLAILSAVARDPERKELLWYFALCLASHHATVATYVPSDVDSKIRGLLWRETKDPGALHGMAALSLRMHDWTLDGYSTRTVDCGQWGIVSGHDGEWLSVLAGAHGRFLALEDAEYAALTGEAIHAELVREACAFADLCSVPGREIDTMRLAMSITHNLGDLNQGMSFWTGPVQRSGSALRWQRLAQENVASYGGIFQYPAALYKEMLAAEGHRHYPLRAVKALRRSPELLLPLGPFLDDYGAMLATSPHLAANERSEVLEALVRGCKKVPNQLGYYRAIAGFQQAGSGIFDDAVRRMNSSAQKLLKEPDLRQKIAISKRSFESAYSKRVEKMRSQHGAALRASAAALRETGQFGLR